VNQLKCLPLVVLVVDIYISVQIDNVVLCMIV